MSNITTKHTTANAETIIEEAQKSLAKLALTSNTLIPTQSLALNTLPENVLIKIFDFADICTSVCLGLSCKNLWKIHTQSHRPAKITLLERTWVWTSASWPRWEKKVYLFQLLKNYMGFTQDDMDMYQETVDLMTEIMSNPDTWMTFNYDDPEYASAIAQIVLYGRHSRFWAG